MNDHVEESLFQIPMYYGVGCSMEIKSILFILLLYIVIIICKEIIGEQI